MAAVARLAQTGGHLPGEGARRAGGTPPRERPSPPPTPPRRHATPPAAAAEAPVPTPRPSKDATGSAKAKPPRRLPPMPHGHATRDVKSARRRKADNGPSTKAKPKRGPKQGGKPKTARRRSPRALPKRPSTMEGTQKEQRPTPPSPWSPVGKATKKPATPKLRRRPSNIRAKVDSGLRSPSVRKPASLKKTSMRMPPKGVEQTEYDVVSRGSSRRQQLSESPTHATPAEEYLPAEEDSDGEDYEDVNHGWKKRTITGNGNADNDYDKHDPDYKKQSDNPAVMNEYEYDKYDPDYKKLVGEYDRYDPDYNKQIGAAGAPTNQVSDRSSDYDLPGREEPPPPAEAETAPGDGDGGIPKKKKTPSKWAAFVALFSCKSKNAEKAENRDGEPPE
eukprot:CAMPEP_0206326606 /NCGR_PEP_ID=MMETSP0106_2-20121207/21706_1 /ASSEMBLY_ACC=CAM_ASM_000206 /TAXON_ID=81532 /ORGANISM="Acanthoeca-like sp., Strain 10tr" /LENGTH=390 /DNA_ID=CAMNT_0053759171 /DNA_START=67 /DNA_END=1239 /DNA_ORIENTATION=+